MTTTQQFLYDIIRSVLMLFWLYVAAKLIATAVVKVWKKQKKEEADE